MSLALPIPFTDAPTLTTPRLVLRAMTEADRDACVRAYTESREHWRPWLPSVASGESPEQQFETRLIRNQQGWKTGVRLSFNAFTLDGGEFVGDCNLNNVVRGAYNNADIGWRVTCGCQGRGYATEIVGAVMTWAFTALPSGGGLHRIQANVMPRNARSMALARRLGYRAEGLAHAMLHINGAYEDHVMFAITAEEWAGRAKC